MSREAAQLAGDVGDVVQIHQGKHDGIENGQHFRDRIQTDPTVILSERGIATPVESILHRPMRPVQSQKALGRTVLLGQSRPAIDHFHAVLLFAGAFALHPKDLPDLAPVAVEKRDFDRDSSGCDDAPDAHDLSR